MRRLFTTLSVLALATVALAGTAAAQLPPPLPNGGTVDLWWSGCDNSAGKLANIDNPTSSTTRMYISIKNREDTLQGYKMDVKWGTQNLGALPEAWQFEAGGCADGGMTPAAIAFNATTCPIGQGARPLFIYQIDPGYIQVGNAFDPFTCDPAKVYTIYRLTMDFSLGCAGTDVPVCAYLYYSETLDSDSIPRMGNMGHRPLTANSPDGSVCSTVPAKPATWGQIKNQYR
jgi:hypothetical protein